MSRTLADKWLAKARRHEDAMRAIKDENDPEWFLHREVAETLRQCAFDLQRESAPR